MIKFKLEHDIYCVIIENKFDNITLTFYNDRRIVSNYIIDIRNQCVIDFYYKPTFKSILKTSEIFDWDLLNDQLYLLTLNNYGKLTIL